MVVSDCFWALLTRYTKESMSHEGWAHFMRDRKENARRSDIRSDIENIE